MAGIRSIFKSIIMGPPASGKGTVSERIVKDFGMRHLASGDLLRQHVDRETHIGKDAKNYMDRGMLVPDDTIMEMILQEMNHPEFHYWLLDGFPRTVPQAEALMKYTKIDYVINLKVPFDVIIDRVQGRRVHLNSGRVYHLEFNPPKLEGLDDVTGEPLVQRYDDKESTVRSRLDYYEQLTEPVLEYFRPRVTINEIQGSYTNEIWPKVHKFLSAHIPALQYTDYGDGK